MQRHDVFCSFILVTAMGIFGVPQLHATENGGTNKIPGVDTVAAGLMPPEGLRMTTFLGYYTASENRDGNGGKPSNISGFHFTAEALTVRFQYVWPGVNWLGANVETRVGQAVYTDIKFRADIQTPVGTIRRRGSDSGPIPGGILGPVMLGWHGQTLHQTLGPLLFYPTRGFDKTQVSNIASGYRSIAPYYGVTWIPNDNWEISTATSYLFNQTNRDTNYQSGRELNIDYGAEYVVRPSLRFGASGYVYKQLTDDRLNGIAVAGGNRGQALAIGPSLRYRVTKDFGITFKWQTEFKVENRAIGNRFYLQFLTVL